MFLHFNLLSHQLRRIALNDPFEIISGPRGNKKLLVLDIDETIYSRSTLRPGLHKMLESVYMVRIILSIR